MQQRQKETPSQSKIQTPVKAKSVQTAPILLDEKALRQIAGGVTPAGPNGNW